MVEVDVGGKLVAQVRVPAHHHLPHDQRIVFVTGKADTAGNEVS